MIRANSTEAVEREGGIARGHRAGVFAVALVASACCFALVPGETLAGSLVQAASLSAVALVAVGAAHPGVLSAPARGACRGWRAWIGYVLVVGLVAGTATFFSIPRTGELAVDPARVAQVVALCLLTGLFEEGVFRVLAIDAFVPAFGGGFRGALRAAAASAVLFGVLHVSASEVVLATDAVAGMQAVLKPVEAGLFGFFMAAVYLATRNLWVLVAVHAAFNMVSTGPLLLAGDMQQTYATGNPFDLALLALTTVLLVPPAVAAFRSFRRNFPNA